MAMDRGEVLSAENDTDIPISKKQKCLDHTSRAEVQTTLLLRTHNSPLVHPCHTTTSNDTVDPYPAPLQIQIYAMARITST